MKILFQTDVLCYRGSTVAITDYVRYNQEILGNESVICYDWARPYHLDGGTEPEVVEALMSEFQVRGYDQISELQRIVDEEKIDVLYNGNHFIPTNCRVVYNEAWQLYNPNPAFYAYSYISEWLAAEMGRRHNQTFPYMPHIVQLPEPTGDLREELNIKPGQTVIGRIGGLFTFNLPFVKQAIVNILSKRDDFVFIFAGTDPWFDHPNVRHVPEFHSPQRKANFFNTCDATLHARSNGESFGLAVAESLSMNKPVLVWEGGEDQNHTFMMRDSGLIYSPDTIEDKLLHIRDYINAEDWQQRVAEFRPATVINKFKEIFLC